MQFARWFGDWQNDPEHSSKVVNDDGTPKVMYRGDSERHTTLRPDFRMDQCMRMLNEYTGGHNSFPVSQGVVDTFLEEYAMEHGGERYSISDVDETSLSQYNGAVEVNANEEGNNRRAVPGSISGRGSNTDGGTVGSLLERLSGEDSKWENLPAYQRRMVSEKIHTTLDKTETGRWILTRNGETVSRKIYENIRTTGSVGKAFEALVSDPASLAEAVIEAAQPDPVRLRENPTKADNEYLDAVKSGDTETARRLVYAYAKESGYNLDVYHGTDEVFNEFKIGDVGYHVGTMEQARDRNDKYIKVKIVGPEDVVKRMRELFEKQSKLIYAY